MKSGDCLVWSGATTPYGHGQTRIRGELHLTHRLMYEWHVGVITPDLFVLHKCDNPPCGKPSHLFLGSYQDNMDDMVRKGRSASGERHSQVRLTEAAVSEIRILLAEGERMNDIAKYFDVARTTVSDIKHNRTWKWVN